MFAVPPSTYRERLPLCLAYYFLLISSRVSPERQGLLSPHRLTLQSSPTLCFPSRLRLSIFDLLNVFPPHLESQSQRAGVLSVLSTVIFLVPLGRLVNDFE